VASDGRIDRSGQRIGMPLHDGVVDLLDLALLECALECGVRALRFGDDHEAARTDIEAVHDALALGCTRGGDAEAGGGQRAEHRRAFPSEEGCAATPAGLSTTTMSSSS
jgi:hypothetical protein